MFLLLTPLLSSLAETTFEVILPQIQFQVHSASLDEKVKVTNEIREAVGAHLANTDMTVREEEKRRREEKSRREEKRREEKRREEERREEEERRRKKSHLSLPLFLSLSLRSNIAMVCSH